MDPTTDESNYILGLSYVYSILTQILGLSYTAILYKVLKYVDTLMHKHHIWPPVGILYQSLYSIHIVYQKQYDTNYK